MNKVIEALMNCQRCGEEDTAESCAQVVEEVAVLYAEWRNEVSESWWNHIVSQKPGMKTRAEILNHMYNHWLTHIYKSQ